MTTRRMNRSVCSALAAVAYAALVTPASAFAEPAWPQWGGPNRNFTAASDRLAATWPEEGPTKLWSRELGDGFSTIVSDGDRLYTLTRGENDQEIVVALDPETGKTVWEFKYDAPYLEREEEEWDEKENKPTGKKVMQKQVTRFGTGPNSTPLLANGRVYTIGFTGLMHCLDAKTGKKRWSHDLYHDFNATYQRFGWATSPIAYRDTVIVLVGGKGRGVMAFDGAGGSVRWQSTDFDCSYSSPIIVNVDGSDHLVAYMAEHVVGLSPENGELHWSLEHKNQYSTAIGTPVFFAPDLLYFVNGGDEAGGRAVRLAKKDGRITPKDVWRNKKIKGGLNNAVPVGRYLYGPNSAGEGARFMIGFDLTSGEILWRDRQVAGAKGVYADGKLILLDDEGKLLLTEPSPAGLKIRSSVQMLDNPSWTAPTLIGTKLYLRDRKKIMALDLS